MKLRYSFRIIDPKSKDEKENSIACQACSKIQAVCPYTSEEKDVHRGHVHLVF
jgi:Na+-translocating ferredoxin:NAD+ oxidoreductase RnfC subunit